MVSGWSIIQQGKTDCIDQVSQKSDNVFLFRAKDYLSTIQLQLTPDEIPNSLIKVHIRITIEGVVNEKVFEADPNIRYTYSWDRLNEYRQVWTGTDQE